MIRRQRASSVAGKHVVRSLRGCGGNPHKAWSKRPTVTMAAENELEAMESSSVADRVASPVFSELSNPDSLSLLERNSVGRIAFSFRDTVDIRPVHYVHEDGWLFGRTSAGDKLITLRHNQWVAFEVDEISGPLDWQSVVVRGSFYVLKREGSSHDLRLHDRATDAIRRLSPNAFTDRDPLAFRTEVFGVSIDSISGRCCSTRE